MRTITLITLATLIISCSDEQEKSESLSSENSDSTVELNNNYNSMVFTRGIKIYNTDADPEKNGTLCNELIGTRPIEKITKINYFPNNFNNRNSGFYEVSVAGYCKGKFRVDTTEDFVFGNITTTFEAYEFEGNYGCMTRIGQWEELSSCEDHLLKIGEKDRSCKIVKHFKTGEDFDTNRDSSRIYDLDGKTEYSRQGIEICAF